VGRSEGRGEREREAQWGVEGEEGGGATEGGADEYSLFHSKKFFVQDNERWIRTKDDADDDDDGGGEEWGGK